MMDLFDLALVAFRRGDYPSAHPLLEAIADEVMDPALAGRSRLDGVLASPVREYADKAR